jgi:hypothetical protein
MPPVGQLLFVVDNARACGFAASSCQRGPTALLDTLYQRCILAYFPNRHNTNVHLFIDLDNDVSIKIQIIDWQIVRGLVQNKTLHEHS